MKTLRELTAELQTLCHEGFSDVPVLASVLEAHYKIGEVHEMNVYGNDGKERKYFVLDTEVLNDY